MPDFEDPREVTPTGIPIEIVPELPVETTIECTNETIDEFRSMPDLTPRERRELDKIERQLKEIQEDFDKYIKIYLGLDDSKKLDAETIKQLIESMPRDGLDKIEKLVAGNPDLVELVEKIKNLPAGHSREEAIKQLSEELVKGFKDSGFCRRVCEELCNDPSVPRELREFFKAIQLAFALANSQIQLLYRSYLQRQMGAPAAPFPTFTPTIYTGPGIGLSPAFGAAAAALSAALKAPEAIILGIMLAVIGEYHAREAARLKGEIRRIKGQIHDLRELELKRAGKDNSLIILKVGQYESIIKHKTEEIEIHLKALSDQFERSKAA